MTNTYAEVKAPHSATAIPGTPTTTYAFVSVAQEVEYLVTSQGAFGPFQHCCRTDGLVSGSPYSVLWLQAHCSPAAYIPLSLSQVVTFYTKEVKSQPLMTVKILRSSGLKMHVKHPCFKFYSFFVSIFIFSARVY